jgi:phosphoribosylformylglycinamidine (FGAM) synthase-like amidotransferase family enzyme
MVPRVIIPVGYGLNCEDETAYAFEMVGAKVDRVFLKDLTERPEMLEDYEVLALIGGFVATREARRLGENTDRTPSSAASSPRGKRIGIGTAIHK